MKDKKIAHFVFSERSKIGEGSYGQVFAGINEITGVKVAVKVLSRNRIDKDVYLRRSFVNEINIMKKLESPNIVKFLDIYETKGNYYIIEEYCSSGDL
jgi:serine/threonine protein kinase